MKREVASCLGPVERDGSTIAAVCRFREELTVFAGHFPGAPLVPGVYLIEAARQAVERGLDRAVALAGVRDGRFVSPVRPGDTVELRVELAEDEAAWEARVEVHRSEELAARFRLTLRPEQDLLGVRAETE